MPTYPTSGDFAVGVHTLAGGGGPLQRPGGLALTEAADVLQVTLIAAAGFEISNDNVNWVALGAGEHLRPTRFTWPQQETTTDKIRLRGTGTVAVILDYTRMPSR